MLFLWLLDMDGGLEHLDYGYWILEYMYVLSVKIWNMITTFSELSQST